MKTVNLLCVLVLIAPFVYCDTQTAVKNPMTISGYSGLNPYDATGDPMKSFPYFKVAFEYGLDKTFGIEGAISYSRWSDYLGLYSGKYTFTVVEPSICMVLHLFPSAELFDYFFKFGISYNFFRVKNEIENPYEGNLKNKFAACLGTGFNVFFFHKAKNALKNLGLSIVILYSGNISFDGISLLAGLSYRVK